MKRMMFLSLCILTACQAQKPSDFKALNDPHTNGIIGGAENPEMRGIVRLRGTGGDCTGAVVGLNPPTVITARHCVESGVTYLNRQYAIKSVIVDFPGYKYDFATQNLSGDLAVLIYPEGGLNDLKIRKKDLFTVAPPAVANGTETSFCGYGLEDDTLYSVSGNLKCGTNTLVVENTPFPYEDLKNKNNSQTSQIVLETLSEHHNRLQQALVRFGPNTSYGVARLALEKPTDSAADYDFGYAGVMPYRGDSGGPWFVTTQGKAPQMFAVSSAVMKIKDESIELVIFAMGWRLDHPWSVQLLEKAASQGANIQGLEELRRSVQ